MLKGIYSEFIKVKLLPCGRITLNVKIKKISHWPLGAAYSLPTANTMVAVLSGE